MTWNESHTSAQELELVLHDHEEKETMTERRTVTIMPTFSLTNLPSLLNNLLRF